MVQRMLSFWCTLTGHKDRMKFWGDCDNCGVEDAVLVTLCPTCGVTHTRCVICKREENP